MRITSYLVNRCKSEPKWMLSSSEGSFLKELEITGSLGQHLGKGMTRAAQWPACMTLSCRDSVTVPHAATLCTGDWTVWTSYPRPNRLSEPTALICSSGVRRSFFHSVNSCQVYQMWQALPGRCWNIKIRTTEVGRRGAHCRGGKMDVEADTLQVLSREP